MQIIDITPTVSEQSAVFPGDTPFQRHVALDFTQGHNLVLSHITTSVHTGAHADAPNHYHPAGVGIDERDLVYYLGPCQVIQVKRPPNRRIHPEHIHNVPIAAKRILFRTDSFPDPHRWTNDFTALSPDLVDHLAQQGVRLVGLDTPSIDLAEDADLISHQRIYANDMAVLENLALSAVEPGHYTLIALPLKLAGADAAPVRAVLIPNGMSINENF